MAARAQARVVGVVQARMTSTRYAGKVLADLGGVPAMQLLLRRLSGARELAEIVLATSRETSDDPLAHAAETAGVRVHRGALDDVLGRMVDAAAAARGEAVARITGDCPLMDAAVVDAVVRRWRDGDEHYVANVLEPRTFPDGMDVEVVTFEALAAAASEAISPHDREHVTPFVSERPDRFPQAGVWLQPPSGELRMTLDTPADLEHMRGLVECAGPDAPLRQLVEAATGADPGPETISTDPPGATLRR